MINELYQNEERDTQKPDELRQKELRIAYREESETPYKNVEIRTLGELRWILRERNWSEGIEFTPEVDRARKDKIALRKINLSGAILSYVNLDGVDLRYANLSYTAFTSAQMKGADLRFADLTGASFWKANLSNANISLTNLSGADLYRANLSGASLLSSRMDIETTLDEIIFNFETRFEGVRWNGTNLTRINWQQAIRNGRFFIGDELEINTLVQKGDRQRLKSRQEKLVIYSSVVLAYRNLGQELKNQSLLTYASLCRLREQRLNRRMLLLEGKLIASLGSRILDLVSGYGELPGRIFITYLLVIVFFSGIYWSWSNLIHTSLEKLQWYEAVVLSFSSFHGRGFFPQAINLGDPLAVIAVFEAVMGLFIEVILIATFSRRFLGN